MKKSVFGAIISSALSMMLIFGTPVLMQFAFIVICITMGLGFLGAFALKEEDKVEMRKTQWFSLIFSGLTLFALLYAGHAVVAAIYFILTFFLVVTVNKKD